MARVAVALETSPDQVVSPETTWHMFAAFLTEMARKAKQIREATGQRTSGDYDVEDLPAAAQAMIEAQPERKSEIMKQFADMKAALARTQPKQVKA